MGGCNDWYIGSRHEIDALRSSNLEPTRFDDGHMWSSTDNTNYSMHGYLTLRNKTIGMVG